MDRILELHNLAELVSLSKRGIAKPLVSCRFKLDKATKALMMLNECKFLVMGVIIPDCINFKSRRRCKGIKSINLATGEVLSRYGFISGNPIDLKVKYSNAYLRIGKKVLIVMRRMVIFWKRIGN